MKIIGVTLLAAVLVLGGCGEDTPTGTQDDSFTVTVRVTDPDGAPVAGASVNAMNALSIDLPAAKARVKIPFGLAEDAVVRLRVRDHAGESVRFLVNETLAAGAYDVSWDGRNDAGEALPAGLYTIALAAYETGSSTAALTGEARVFLMRLERAHVLGVTDADGELALTDPDLFQGLLLPGDLELVDENGELAGAFSLLVGGRFWAWTDDVGPVAVAEEALADGPNTVTLVLDPEAKVRGDEAPASAPHLLRTGAKDGSVPWFFARPYPNPFN